MPSYTVTAFCWSEAGYNAQYNTSYTAVLQDNDGTYQGGVDSDETISIDGGAFNPSLSNPLSLDISFTDTGGNPHVETFYFFSTAGPPEGWYFIPGPGSAFTVGATLGSYQSHTTGGWDYDSVACFTGGTLIETPEGDIPVEDLGTGDRVRLYGGGSSEILTVLSRRVKVALSDKLVPIRISAGALGPYLPRRDLLVSRQHRMLINSPICERMFGTRDVLVPAHSLCSLPGIYSDDSVGEVTYFHIVTQSHKVIMAEGAPTESFSPGPEAIKSLTPAARAEFEALFPDFTGAPEKARFEPAPRQRKRLLRRHLKNEKPVLQSRV